MRNLIREDSLFGAACVVAAGAAYDQHEADELRSKTDQMLRSIDSLRFSLQEHEGASA